MEYERQVASLKAANAAENDFSVSQAEVSSRQAMLENASDIKVRSEGPLPTILLREAPPFPEVAVAAKKVNCEWFSPLEDSLEAHSIP